MTDTASTGGTSLAQHPAKTVFETELLSQPDAVRDAITLNLDPIRAAMALVAGARRIRLAGSGIEYYAAEAGAWMIRDVGITAFAARAYDLANYPTGFEPGDLIVVISNHEPDSHVLSVLNRARSSGLKTVAICSSGVLVEADAIIETGPEEQSRTPSLSVTQPMAVLAAIAARFEPRSMLASAVPTLPETIRGMMNTREIAADVSSEITANERRVLITGAGQMRPVAHLGAMTLLASTRYVVTDAHTDDVLRGELDLLTPGDVLIQIAPDGASNQINGVLRREADNRELNRWKIGGMVDNARWGTRLPEIPEVITPLHAIVPIQWLALELSIALGVEPDRLSSDESHLATASS